MGVAEVALQQVGQKYEDAEGSQTGEKPPAATGALETQLDAHQQDPEIEQVMVQGAPTENEGKAAKGREQRHGQVGEAVVELLSKRFRGTEGRNDITRNTGSFSGPFGPGSERPNSKVGPQRRQRGQGQDAQDSPRGSHGSDSITRSS